MNYEAERPIQIAASAALGLVLASSGFCQGSPAVDPDADCLACHDNKDLKSESGLSVYVDASRHKASVHSVLPCTSCHSDIKEFPHPKRIAKVECAVCHSEPAADLPESIHRRSSSCSFTTAWIFCASSSPGGGAGPGRRLTAWIFISGLHTGWSSSVFPCS